MMIDCEQMKSMKGYPDRNCVKSIIVGILLLLCGRFLMAQSYHIGDLYTAADGSQGIVYYIHPDGSGGWVVALNDASTACAWGAYGDVPDLENYNPGTYFQQLLYDTAGYANTRSIRNYQNNNSYAAGVVDFENGWVLPSLMQLRMLYGQLPYITSALLSAGGTTLANDWYWSSTEMHYRDAWCIFFGSNNSVAGGFSYFQKNYNYRVRAVRSFSYTTENADVTAGISCSWSTGDTTSSIVVTPTQTTTYSVIVSTEDGCSDTVEHTIVVNTADPEEITQTACESYEWNGQIYTESGEYTQTFTAANGCDSVVVLHLTVSIVPEVTIVATDDTICAGDEVTLEAVLTNAEYILQIPPIAAGDILCTDNTIVKPSDWPVQGKTAMGVVFYVDNTGEHGWAMHLQNQGTNMIWGNQGDIQTLTNYPEGRTALQDYDGQSNTQKIRNKGGSSTYPSAWAVDFANGWYLPSIGQLAVFVSELETVDATLALLGATTFPPDEYFRMWSSTESGSAHAWCIQGTGEIENHVYKNITSTHFIVRSVRSF